MSEKSEIKRMGATPVKNSGRGLFKGDAIKGPFVVDIKEYGKSFGLTKAVWSKVSTDAWTNGRREPALCVVLGEEGEQKLRLWVIGEGMFEDMFGCWQDANHNHD